MKRTLGSIAVTVSLFLALSFCFERNAYGYVDPGSGLLVFQSLSAAVAGAIFYFRRHIKSLFIKAKNKSHPPEETR